MHCNNYSWNKILTPEKVLQELSLPRVAAQGTCGPKTQSEFDSEILE